MRRDKSGFAIAILTLVLVSLSTGFGMAQDAGQQKPPVSIGGYSYKYVPTGRIHSFVCEVKVCVPGSKVSYQLYPPDNDLDFEKFKLSQEMVASYLKKHAPKGTTIEFGTPRRTVNELYTAFENTSCRTEPNCSPCR